MHPPLARQLVEFGRTIRFSHTLFALPFGLGAALVAEPPWPDGWSLALLVACMVTARTAAMGANRVADAALDARNPRTADRAIPAGRLSRRVALALALGSGGAFLGLAWLFVPLRGNAWPGLAAPGVLAVLVGYSWTKRWTVLAHWLLGLCLGLAPVGAWLALRAEVGWVPLLVGGGVLFWTAGFDILYALQDLEVDRREGLRSVPARLGPRAARWMAVGSHLAMLGFLAAAILYDRGPDGSAVLGEGSALALQIIALVLVVHHWRMRRADAATLAAAFTPVNAAVSLLWLAGAFFDAAFDPAGRILG